MPRILVTGAAGQIGSELVPALRARYGNANVVALINKTTSPELEGGPIERADVTDAAAIEAIVKKHGITQIYHLVSLLSATGEKDPQLAWKVNMGSLKLVLDLAVAHKMEKVFWPSSIAAFGPTTPRDHTPQRTVLEPTTIYGVTKVAGELLCQYYHKKYGLDVRSVRYPGLISWKTPPGGGTTDYAVAIFYDALQKGRYTCFVKPETALPMMYMDDAIRATIDLMEAPASAITIRTSYNLGAISFTAKELASAVAKRVPGFSCDYAPDHRQAIADSWPRSVDDSQARKDWGWKERYDLPKMSDVMLHELRAKFGK